MLELIEHSFISSEGLPLPFLSHPLIDSVSIQGDDNHLTFNRICRYILILFHRLIESPLKMQNYFMSCFVVCALCFSSLCSAAHWVILPKIIAALLRCIAVLMIIKRGIAFVPLDRKAITWLGSGIKVNFPLGKNYICDDTNFLSLWSMLPGHRISAFDSSFHVNFQEIICNTKHIK